jgi:hypothetical protein
VDADVERITYLRFVVGGVNGRPVEQARLQLAVAAPSVSGGTVHLITDTTWDEATVTYATRPAVDGVGLDTLGAVATGDVVEFNLDGVITGDGIYNLAIDSLSTDGVTFESAEATSGQPVLVLTVIDQPNPTASILQPPDAAAFFVGDLITLQGQATDSVDGDLSAVIGWSSDLDGALGTGAVVTTALSEGTHTVTATVTDSDGLSDAVQISLGVIQPPAGNTPPLVAITAPINGETFSGGEATTFTGTANDLQDGMMTPALTWISSLDGVLGSGGTFTKLLSVGTHEITARATDSGGLEGMATVTVIVTPWVPLEFAPGADAYVDAAKPTTNFGASTQLRVDADAERVTYLRFAVTGVDARTVTRAILRLQVDSARGSPSESGGIVHTISTSSWQESTVTHNTRPPVDGPALASAGAVASGEVVEFDVTAAVSGDGIINLALVSSSSDAATYRSRESAAPPTLSLTIDGPTIGITAPADQALFMASDNPIAFTGEAADNTGADLSSQILWTSSIDGVLGSGAAPVFVLSLGHHAISATVTDAAGVLGSAQITVAVLSPPAVTITTPAPGTIVVLGNGVTFCGGAIDATDGDLSASLEWTSDRDGLIGTGTIFNTSTLSLGTHTVTAAVSDSDGLVGEAQSSVHVQVTAGDVGFRDFSFGSADSAGDRITASKPESKLWYNDGIWWATLFTTTTGAHHIHALDPVTQTWIDTGVLVDPRDSSRQDVLWDGEKLYMASRAGVHNRLYRYSYDPSGPTYVLDPGFPVDISGGGTEAITIAKDSTGTLWIAYTVSGLLDGQVFVNRTVGSDTEWGNPFVVPVSSTATTISVDDIAGVQALPGKIGVFWSNQLTDTFYFAVHTDGASATAPGAWDLEIAAQGADVADDHLNLKAASDGRLFAAIKTGTVDFSPTRIGLLIRSPSGSWSSLHHVMNGELRPTRPQCLLDEAAGLVYVFYSLDQAAIYYKVTSMDAIDFPSGVGTPFINSSTVPDINNPTTTKQTVGASTGLAVVASSPGEDTYWHNTIGLPVE